MLLLSNSTAPGQGFLEHAVEAIADVLGDGRRMLFFGQASSEPRRYAQMMEEALQPIGVAVTLAGARDGLAGELKRTDAVFVGGGNSFRLLKALQESDMIERIRERVKGGVPYLGASAGSNLACPTIRTTNDMPIVEPRGLGALALVPFQINPHYFEPVSGESGQGESRDDRIAEFLDENDVPVLALREGAWLEVRGASASIGGVADGRIFERGLAPRDVPPGGDVSVLLERQPGYDAPLTSPPAFR